MKYRNRTRSRCAHINIICTMMEPEPVSVTQSGQADQPVKSRMNLLLCCHATATVVILLVAVILRFQHATEGCAGELNDGEWFEEGVWQPYHCTLHHFQTSELEVCRKRFHRVVVIGAEKWKSAANLICPDQLRKDTGDVGQEAKSHTCIARYIGQSNTCEAVDGMVQQYIALAQSVEKEGPLLIIHQPLCHICSKKGSQDNSETLSTCRGAIQAQLNAQHKLLKARPGSLIVQLDPNPAWKLPGTDATALYKEMYSSAGSNNSQLLYLTSAFETGFAQSSFAPNEGTAPSVPPELSLILNTYCASDLPSLPSSACCAHSSQSHYFAVTILILILAMYLGVGLILLSGATFALIPHLEAVNFDLEGFISALHSIGGGAFIMLYILLADGLEYFASVDRSYSLVSFLLCVLVIVAVAALTSRRADRPELLSVGRCNAWRGGMILVYIALQYYNMDQAVAGRLFGELLVGGLVFISGYTHFTHYWIHADFSWKRLGTVLCRLNLLPVLLSLTLSTSYGAYCLPVLLTLGFLFTSAFMASWPQMTPASLQGISVQGPQHVVVVVKFGFAFLLITFLPWIKGIIHGVASLPVLGSVLQSHNGDTDTLYHWMYAHRYMTLGGMVFGYVMCNVQSNSPSAVEGFRKLKAVTAVFSAAILLGYVVFLVSAKDFAWSAESQSLIAVPVMVSYALLCYCSEPLQRYESSVLTALGSSAVWLFMSHQHILLNRRGSAVLVLVPGLPHSLNSVLVLCVFLFCQRLMQFAQHTLSRYTMYTHPSTDPTQNTHMRPPLQTS